MTCGERPYLRHLSASDDLVTTRAEVRAGFVAMALEKSRRATPFIEEARALKTAASVARVPEDLLNIPNIRPALLVAANVSDKACNHLIDMDKDAAIQALIEKHLISAGEAFVEELVFRFLLTRGDTLGGSMRNFAGQLAQRSLSRAIIASLTISRESFQWLDTEASQWVLADQETDTTDIETHAGGFCWQNNEASRTLIFNKNVPIVEKNVDIILLVCPYSELASSIRDLSSYVALGELKGGIDPAGADEHWKTANTALSRIREVFAGKGLSPCTLFVGAAIEVDMAREICNQLNDGTLSNAANLTKPDQLASLCKWLTDL